MRGHRQRCQRGELVRPCQSGIEIAEAMHAAGGVEVRGRILHRGDEHRPGDGPTQLAGEALDRPVVDDETEPGGRNAEPARRRRHANVAGHGELGAGAEGGTVDGGDGRDGQLGEPAQHAAERLGELALLDAHQVGAGAERRRSARQHEHAGVGGDALSVEQGEQRGVVDGVATLGTVERDDEDTVTLVAVPRHPYHAPTL